MAKIKHYLFLLIIICFLFYLGLPTSAAIFTSERLGQIRGGLQQTASLAGLTMGDPKAIITTLTKTVLGFTGALFFTLIIYAGVKWMTSAGNEEKIKKAKHLIINSIIGLVLIFTASAISLFIVTAIEMGAPPSTTAPTAICTTITEQIACLAKTECSWNYQTNKCLPKTPTSTVVCTPDECTCVFCEDCGSGVFNACEREECPDNCCFFQNNPWPLKNTCTQREITCNWQPPNQESQSPSEADRRAQCWR